MLSQKTRYALRALLHLAEADAGRSVQAQEIAADQRVPRKYLELILLDLKRAGFVTSRRGPGGGYVLAKDAAEISFADVIRVTDGPIALVPCASETFYARCEDCHDEARCAIRRLMVQVREDTLRTLAHTSLADAAAFEIADAASGEIADAASGEIADAASGEIADAASGEIADAASGEIADAAGRDVRPAAA